MYTMFVNKLKEIILIMLLLSVLLNLAHTFFSGMIQFGLNKIYTLILIIFTIGLSIGNLFLTVNHFNKLEEECEVSDNSVCMGFSFYFNEFCFYFFIISPILLVTYLILKLAVLKVIFKTLPFGNFLPKNKDTYYAFLFTGGLRILFNTVFVCLLALEISTGFNENISVGSRFYVPEVRATYYNWFNYLGFAFLILLWVICFICLTAFEKFLISSIFSQWYFNRNKLWLKGAFVKGIKASVRHVGSFIHYALVISWCSYFNFAFEKMKFYLDSIEICKNRQKPLVFMFKPFIYLYDHFFKYKHPHVIYDLALFGKSIRMTGFRCYYLKYRNWSRFKPFYKGMGIYSVLTCLFNFNLFYLLLVIWVSIVQAPLLESFSFSSLNYLFYYPFLLSFFFTFNSKESSDVLNKSFELLIYCFVLDEEMFQGKQKYCEEDLKEFIDSLSKETEKTFLKKVINEQGITKNLDERFQKFFAKKIKKDEVKDRLLNIITSDDLRNREQGEQEIDIEAKPIHKGEEENQFENKKVVKEEGEKENQDESREGEINLIDYIRRRKEKIKKQNQKFLEKKQETNSKPENDNDEGENEREAYALDPNSIAAALLKNLKKKPVKKVENKFKVVVENKKEDREETK